MNTSPHCQPLDTTTALQENTENIKEMSYQEGKSKSIPSTVHCMQVAGIYLEHVQSPHPFSTRAGAEYSWIKPSCSLLCLFDQVASEETAKLLKSFKISVTTENHSWRTIKPQPEMNSIGPFPT